MLFISSWTCTFYSCIYEHYAIYMYSFSFTDNRFKTLIQAEINVNWELSVFLSLSYSTPQARWKFRGEKTVVFWELRMLTQTTRLSSSVSVVKSVPSVKSRSQVSTKWNLLYSLILRPTVNLIFCTVTVNIKDKRKHSHFVSCFACLWFSYFCMHDVHFNEKVNATCNLNLRKNSVHYLGSRCWYDWFSLSTEPEWDFMKLLEDVEGVERDKAVFECDVNDPEAEVTWWRGDKVSVAKNRPIFIQSCYSFNVSKEVK